MKRVTAAILELDGKILLARRAKGCAQQGKWEFPGGTIEPGETPEECLKREIREELDIEVTVGEFVGDSTYEYEHGTIQLLAYRTHWLTGKITLMVHDDCAWVNADSLLEYDLAPADIPLARTLMKHL